MKDIIRSLPYCKFTAVEETLLTLILKLLITRECLILRIKEHANNDWKKVIEAAQELQDIDKYNGVLVQYKELFWDKASIEVLNKIINEDKFERQYGEPFTITKEVLRDFRYGYEVNSNNPKAYLAKKLGAKIIN